MIPNKYHQISYEIYFHSKPIFKESLTHLEPTIAFFLGLREEQTFSILTFCPHKDIICKLGNIILDIKKQKYPTLLRNRRALPANQDGN